MSLLVMKCPVCIIWLRTFFDGCCERNGKCWFCGGFVREIVDSMLRQVYSVAVKRKKVFMIFCRIFNFFLLFEIF